MSRNNTGNPIGSKAFPDFEDNVKNLDQAVNAEQDTFQDRLGKSRLTWAGIIKAGSGDPAIAVDAAARAESAASSVEQNAEQIAQDAAQQAVDNVVIAVDGAVGRAEGAADRAETARDASLLSTGIWPTTAAGIGQGVAGTSSLVAGSGGTDGTFDLAFSGGTQVLAPKGRFVVEGNELTQIIIDYPGYYSAGTPTISFAASSGLTGASASVVMGPNTPVGGYFNVAAGASQPAFVERYKVVSGPAAEFAGVLLSDKGVDAIFAEGASYRFLTPDPRANQLNPSDPNFVIGQGVGADGKLTTSMSPYNTSGFIPVREGYQIWASRTDGSTPLIRSYAFYDRGKQVVSVSYNEDQNIGSPNGFTAPAGACYLRVTYRSNSVNYMVSVGSGPVDYRAYSASQAFSIDKSVIKTQIDAEELLMPAPGYNLLNPGDPNYTVGAGVSADGSLSPNMSPYSTTGFIPVKPGYVISCSRDSGTYGLIRSYAFYDSNFVRVSFEFPTDQHVGADNGFAVPDGVAYLRLSFRSDSVNYMISTGADPQAYKAYTPDFKYTFYEPRFVVDPSIDPENPAVQFSDVIQPAPSANLLNPEDPDYVAGQGIGSDGALSPSLSAYFTTGYIPVQPGYKIWASRAAGTAGLIRSYALYGENKELVTFDYNSDQSIGSANGFTVPDGCYFLRLSYRDNSVDYMIAVADAPQEYTPYSADPVYTFRPEKVQLPDARAASPWAGLKVSFDGDSITAGFLAGGTPYASKVAAKLGMQIYSQAIGGATICAADGGDVFTSVGATIGAFTSSSGEITDPNYNMTAMIDISGTKGDLFLLSDIVDIKSIRAYVLYDESMDLIQAYGNATLNALNVNYLDASDQGSASYIRIAYPAAATDVQLRKTSRKPIVWRSLLLENADLIVIAGGTNDWSYQLPLGVIADRTPFTFYGALHLLCLDLLERHTGKQLVLMTPIKRFAFGEVRNGQTQRDFADAIVSVGAYYGIPVLDMHSVCTLNPAIPSQASALFADASGHPNQAGHEVMANTVSGFINTLKA